jgi:hypothetical protein
LHTALDHFISEVVEKLYHKALEVSKLTLEKSVDLPRNYVMRSISNLFCTLVRKQVAKLEAEILERGSASGSDQYSSFGEDIENRMVLQQFRRSQKGTGYKAAQVIELVYLLECSESEAYALLEFGKTEAETVMRKIREWRQVEHSLLHRFVRSFYEGEADA